MNARSLYDADKHRVFFFFVFVYKPEAYFHSAESL